MRKSLKVTKFIKTIIKIIFILMFIILILYNVMNINNEEEYVDFMGYKIFVVQDYQNQSTIKKGTILITKTKNNNLEINDIIAIKISEGTYFHRIVDLIGNERYITKGDDNYEKDKHTYSIDDIEGKIVGRIPWFGRVFNIAKTKIFSVIILIVLMITFRYNKHIYIKMNKRRLKQKSNNNQI